MAWDDMAAPFLEDRVGLDPETVVYRPADGDPPREITAVVDRQPPAVIAEARGARAPRWRMWVQNDPDLGIAADELDTGGDQIDVSERISGAAETRVILRLISQDNGMLCVEVG